MGRYRNRGAGREGTIHRQGTHGEQVALAGDHPRGHPGDEVRHIARHGRSPVMGRGGLRGGRHPVQLVGGGSDGSQVPVDHDGAALAVAVLDRLGQSGHRLVEGEHTRDGEEAGLHDRVDAPADARPASRKPLLSNDL